ncbi:hypothetical protein [Streptomyces sp. NPDC021622]|uniref:hypothetical protein n=1 Tax=Streptomyces sp. NPDC021622 TaxID=3155013 RepID=UPI0033D56898
MWETSAEPPRGADYDFDVSWHYRFVVGLLFAVSAVAGVCAVLAALGMDPWGPPCLGWAALGALVFGWFVLWFNDGLLDPENFAYATVPFALSFDWGRPTDFEELVLLVSGLVLAPAAVAVCGAIVTAGAAAWLHGMVKDARARRAKDMAGQVARLIVTGLRSGEPSPA